MHAIRAIDGKHIVKFAPANQGLTFFNYKKTHYIALMTVWDANYKFTLMDTGRESVYANSYLGYAIENNLMDISNDSTTADANRVLPYVFVADGAFRLKVTTLVENGRKFPFQFFTLMHYLRFELHFEPFPVNF